MKFFKTLLVLSLLSTYVHLMIIMCTGADPLMEITLGFMGSFAVGLFSWMMIERLDEKERA
jgi:hypothetical protein